MPLLLPREILRVIFLNVLENQKVEEAKRSISVISRVCTLWRCEMRACFPLFFEKIGINLLSPVVLHHRIKQCWRNYEYTQEEIIHSVLDGKINVVKVFRNDDYIIACDKHKLAIIDPDMLIRIFNGISIPELSVSSTQMRLYSTARGPIICALTIFGECGILYFDKEATWNFSNVSSLRSVFFTGNYYIYEPKIGTDIVIENIFNGERLFLNKNKYKEVLHSYNSVLLIESITSEYYLFDFTELKVIKRFTEKIAYYHNEFIITLSGVLYDIHLKTSFKTSLKGNRVLFIYKNKLQYHIITTCS